MYMPRPRCNTSSEQAIRVFTKVAIKSALEVEPARDDRAWAGSRMRHGPRRPRASPSVDVVAAYPRRPARLRSIFESLKNGAIPEPFMF